MYRNLCLLVVLAVALMGVLSAPQAMAQAESPCRFVEAEEPVVEDDPLSDDDAADDVDDDAGDDDAGDDAAADMGPVFGDDFVIDSAEATPLPTCADAVSYPGPFTNTPATPSGPFAIPDVQIAPAQRAAVTAVVAEPPSPSLAHSGSEVFVLAYLGTGLLAFGAVALGMRRSSVPR